MAGVEALQRRGYSDHFFAFHLTRLFTPDLFSLPEEKRKLGGAISDEAAAFASLSPFTRGEDKGEGLDASRMLVARH
jgi:hypothetical protein